jgi:hypothetical protein
MKAIKTVLYFLKGVWDLDREERLPWRAYALIVGIVLAAIFFMVSIILELILFLW